MRTGRRRKKTSAAGDNSRTRGSQPGTGPSERPPAMAGPARPRDWLLAGALVAAVFLVYQPAWQGGFVWDDDAHVTRPELRSWHGLYRIWFDLGATQQYYPLLHSVFWVEHRLWGSTTLGYHLVSIGLHALAALMVALILRRLSIPGAYLAAAIFALHPVQVESVAWITEQKNTLSAVFYLGAMFVYFRFDRHRSGKLYAAALGLFLLGLTSKTVTATLPGALLVILWWQRGTLSWRRDVRPLLPFFAVGAVAGVFTAVVERKLVGAEGAAYAIPVIDRCLIAGRVVWFYLGKLFWPGDLIFIYPRWNVSHGEGWQYLFPAAALVLLGVLWSWRRRRRGPLAALLFFVGTLFPVLGFCNVYPFIYSFVADHFQYLASLGIITLVSAGIALAFRLGVGDQRGDHGRGARPANACAGGQCGPRGGAGVAWRPAGYAFCFALLTVLAVLTWRQSRMYTDVERLYRQTISQNPDCAMAYTNLGVVLAGRGNWDEAMALYLKALKIKPGDPESHNDLATVLARRGRFDEAVAQLRAALQTKPDYAEAHVNLGNVLNSRGQADAAMAEFRRALEIDPGSAGAHNNLGFALAQRGRIGEAMAHYERALETKPDFAEAHVNLGVALLWRGRIDEATAHFQAALKIDPDSAIAHINFALALASQGKVSAAIWHLRRALELNPRSVDAHVDLALTLELCGRVDDAMEHYKEAVEIDPNHTVARRSYAAALAGRGRVSEAIANYRKALALAAGQNDTATEEDVKARLRALGAAE